MRIHLPAAVLVLACGVVARGEEGLGLSYRIAKDDHWAIDEELTVQVKLAVSAKGQETRSMEQTTKRVRRGELTVVKAEGGRLDGIRLKYGAECFDAVEGDEPSKTPAALAGQAVTVKRRKDGVASVKCDAQLSDAEMAEARALLELPEGLLPEGSVKAGDRWTADEKALPASVARLLAMENGDECKVALSLKEVHAVDGRKIAEIEIGVALKQKRDGSTTTYKLLGTALVDAATGVALAEEIHGTLATRGEAEQGGTKVTIEGKGEIRFTSGPKPAAPAGVAAFGHMTFTAPPGWTAKAYANGVVVSPSDLKDGQHLDITVMESLASAGTLEDALKTTWADVCKQQGAEPLHTVDGTPWEKPDGRTSFKGWEYLRAGGSVRRADGDIDVHVLLVKLNGRIERISVASPEHSYRRDRSCYWDPRYYDRIQEFLFGIGFDDWQDPERTVATLKGDGIVGVWTGISMHNGSIEGGYLILFSNGQAWYASKFPFYGIAGMDTWVDSEMHPREWGRWTFKDGAGVVTLRYQEMPLRLVAGSLVVTSLKTDHKYVKIASVDGARFDGTWAYENEKAKPSITFTPSGAFTDNGALTILIHQYPLVVETGSGTYEVADHTLVLKFADGREFRVAFPGWGVEKGNTKPGTLVLSNNEDTLTRQ